MPHLARRHQPHKQPLHQHRPTPASAQAASAQACISTGRQHTPRCSTYQTGKEPSGTRQTCYNDGVAFWRSTHNPPVLHMCRRQVHLPLRSCAPTCITHMTNDPPHQATHRYADQPATRTTHVSPRLPATPPCTTHVSPACPPPRPTRPHIDTQLNPPQPAAHPCAQGNSRPPPPRWCRGGPHYNQHQ